MIPATLLLAAGLAVVWWRPCRLRGGWAPRSAIALLLAATAAIWVGSFALIVAVVSGEAGATLTACGVLWQQLLAGQLSWWQTSLSAAWVVAFPLHGIWATSTCARRSRRLLWGLRPVAAPFPDGGGQARRMFLVPGLSTPAVTLGVLRPVILVDRAFWDGATALQRTVVLAHERGHRNGCHGLVDALARLLTAPLAPLPAAAHVYDCVRRHLEALADDAAVRRHGRRCVGVTLGRVALAAYPRAGLGTSGTSLWRVQRLVADSQRRCWHHLATLLGMVVVLTAALWFVAADAAVALGPVTGADFCRI